MPALRHVFADLPGIPPSQTRTQQPADAPRRMEPQTPRMARVTSIALIQPREQPRDPVRYRVALLTGCIQDLVFPDVNRDTADVLLANGCSVDTPPVQPCCGSLHAHNGE